MRRGVIFLAALASLAGCAGEADVYAVIQDRAYTPSEFHRASQGKILRTTIVGNPFNELESALVQNTLDAMQPANWWYSEAFTPRVQFASLDPSQAVPDYHIAVRFGDERLPPDQYCVNPAAQSLPAQGTGVQVRLSFCRGTTLLSTSGGALNNLSGSAEPAFKKMIARMTMALFPQRRDTESCGPMRQGRRC